MQRTILFTSVILTTLISPVMAQEAIAQQAPAEELTQRERHLRLINEAFGAGVSPSENAVVMIYQAYGPHPENSSHPPEFYDALGIAEPPEEGNYFDGFPEGVDIVRFNEQLDRAMAAPWKKEDCPLIHRWLEEEAKPIEIVVQSLERPHWFSPVMPGRDEQGNREPLFMTLLPATQQHRGVARALVCRAMLHTANGDAEKAWQDLLACHRFGRMISRGPTLIDYLVGIAVSSIANAATTVCVQNLPLDASDYERLRSELAALPPIADPHRVIRLTERIMTLDVIATLEDGRHTDTMAMLFGTEMSRFERFALAFVDWDIVRFEFDVAFNAIDEAHAIADHRERSETLAAHLTLIRNRGQMTARNVILTLLTEQSLQSAISRLAAWNINGAMLPAFGAVDTAGVREQTRSSLLDLFLQLQQFRVQHGHFPQQLTEIAFSEGGDDALDPFSMQPFQYLVTDAGFRLYSVGPNGIDEGGLPNTSERQSDDLYVSVPPTKLD